MLTDIPELAVLLIPIAYTIVRTQKALRLCLPLTCPKGAKYGIASEGLIGALFLPSGFDNFGMTPRLTGRLILFTCTVGAPIGGRISDAVVRRAKEERKGIWVPEDRLRAVWVGGLVLIPVSVTLAGFTTEYVDGMIGLVINLVCFFTNGLGVSHFSDISDTDASIH